MQNTIESIWDFPAADAALPEAQARLEEALEEAGFSAKVILQFSVSLEEMFVNVAHYAYPDGNGSVRMVLSVSPEGARLTLIDSGIPFNPLEAAAPDIDLPAEDRPIGGLGIFMTRKLMDRVKYCREDGRNVLTLEKDI